MASHLDDEEQVENLKRWWKENWLALVAGVGLGLGAIGGWQGWQHWQDGQAQAASRLHEDLKQALEGGQTEEAVGIADRLTREFASSPYAASAALRLARADVEAARYEEAVGRLAWVAAHAEDAATRDVARVRQARVLLAQGKLDAALPLLDAVGEPYRALAEEVRGDLLLAKGDRSGARAAYDKALQGLDEQAANRELLQQKRDDLGASS